MKQQSVIARGLLAALLMLGFAGVSMSQDGGPVYVVTYIEAQPGASELLKELQRSSREAMGNLEFEALERIGRPNHYAIVEIWTDAAALEAHATSAEVERFDSRLAPLLISPPDRRIEQALLTGPQRDAGPAAVYVLVHVDVIPPNLSEGVDLLKVLAEAGRGEPGNLRFDVLVTERRNHMTILETWQSAEAEQAHELAPGTRAFRQNLSGLLGALYDERLYRKL